MKWTRHQPDCCEKFQPRALTFIVLLEIHVLAVVDFLIKAQKKNQQASGERPRKYRTKLCMQHHTCIFACSLEVLYVSGKISIVLVRNHAIMVSALISSWQYASLTRIIALSSRYCTLGIQEALLALLAIGATELLHYHNCYQLLLQLVALHISGQLKRQNIQQNGKRYDECTVLLKVRSIDIYMLTSLSKNSNSYQ